MEGYAELFLELGEGKNMLNAFDYKNMWEGFFEEWGKEGEWITNIGDLMNQYKKDYIERNKNKLGYHGVEEFYKD